MVASQGRSTRNPVWTSFSRQQRHEIRAVIAGTFQTQSGVSLQMLALAILALNASGSPASVPVVIAAGAAPPVLFVWPIRRLLRWMDCRWIMGIADVAAGVATLLIPVAAQFHDIGLAHIYLQMFAVATCSAFHLPAMRQWATETTADSEALVWLNSWTSIASQTSVILGWAAGGWLATVISPMGVLWICAGAYGLSAIWQFLVFARIAPIGSSSVHDPDHTDDARKAQATTWREVLSLRRLGLFALALIALGLAQRLSFTMFIPLLTQGDQADSWIPGLINGAFGAMAIVGNFVVSRGPFAASARNWAPQIISVAFVIQIGFAFASDYPYVALALYSVVGFLSAGGTVLQSEVQNHWRGTGAGHAFTVFNAVQAPVQLIASLALSAVLLHLPVLGVYVAIIFVFGVGSGVLAVAARKFVDSRQQTPVCEGESK